MLYSFLKNKIITRNDKIHVYIYIYIYTNLTMGVKIQNCVQ